MADSIMSITVRDTKHPCAPYQSSQHRFVAQIYYCDGKPLHWKGLNGLIVPLGPVMPGGPAIHRQVRVPPGCYLVRAVATCSNVITDWAWVEVCCDQTVCVDLVIGRLLHCVLRMRTGLGLGGPDEGPPVKERMPNEVQDALKELKRIADGLPAEPGPGLPDPPTADEIEEMLRHPPEEKDFQQTG